MFGRNFVVGMEEEWWGWGVVVVIKRCVKPNTSTALSS